jgi:hypothetical protein
MFMIMEGEQFYGFQNESAQAGHFKFPPFNRCTAGSHQSFA